MNDGVLFYKIILKNTECILFVSDIFLYQSPRSFFGKLMYTTQPVFGKKSLFIRKSEKVFFKAAYRYMNNNTIIPLTDSQLQTIGINLGLIKGTFLDRLLCGPPSEVETEIMLAPRLIDYYNINDIAWLLDIICSAYNITSNDLLLTGSLHLFPRPLENVHDIDIVIPVDSLHHLNLINKYYLSSEINLVSEYNYIWPLRWYNDSGQIICPFFIYRGLSPPVLKIRPLGKNISGRVRIVDTRFSIFNMPIVETKSLVDLLIFRSTLLRGMLKKGQFIDIDCPLCVVEEGIYSGAMVGLITDPFMEIININQILNEWHV